MKKPLNSPDSPKKPVIFGELNVETSLWVLLPKAAVAILISVILFLIVFWLQVGELNAFAFGFAIFLAALQILIIVGLRFQNRPEAHTTVKAKNDFLDKIGAWWLMACAFGAFFGWGIGKAGEFYAGDQQIFHIIKVILTIVLPVLTMLPNARYISSNAAHIQVPILFSITLLPVLVGINSAITLWNDAKF